MTRRRGEAYYPRSALSELHTAERWRLRHGREVLPLLLGAPAKLVPKRGHNPEPSMDLEARALGFRGGRAAREVVLKMSHSLNPL